MAQIGNVPEIIAVKRKMESLKEKGLVADWELPYENLLSRLTAAIFFLTPAKHVNATAIWDELQSGDRTGYPDDRLRYRLNEEKKLSRLEWRVEFNKEPEA